MVLTLWFQLYMPTAAPKAYRDVYWTNTIKVHVFKCCFNAWVKSSPTQSIEITHESTLNGRNKINEAEGSDLEGNADKIIMRW